MPPSAFSVTFHYTCQVFDFPAEGSIVTHNVDSASVAHCVTELLKKLTLSSDVSLNV